MFLACATLAAACSSGSGKGGTAGNGSQGSAGNNATAGTTGSGGSATGTGGSTTGTGGSATGTGGSATGTGGSATGTGGSATGTGGSATGTGGSATGTGGSATGTGGTTTGTGGSATGTAGATGGNTGTAGAGGAAGAAGTIGPGGAPPTCQAPTAITTGTAATVTATLTTTVRASVSPDFFGIHTSVYDGNMQLATTPDLLKAAGVTSLRWPGGSYADLYHWSTNTGTYTPASGAGSNTIYIADNTDFGAFLGFMGRVGANALITVNYGTNWKGTGPGEPKEAAAMVAYANGSASSTQSIGADSTGKDWMTVGFWATLRGAAKMPTDDGYNKFRIGHAAPFGIKYWEIGNELYGNGYYYGACGWEADMHVAYPATPDGGTANCTNRQNNSALSPASYGTAVKAYADAMKAVDSSIKIGGIVVGTSDTEYTNPDWNSMALGAGCSKMDFVSLHWYAPATTKNITIQTVATVPELEIPATFTRVRNALMAANCPGGNTMPIAITEWGPNTNNGAGITIPMSTATAAPVGSQVLGLFAAEAYANFLEQGALATHWLELHNNSYLASVDATNDPFTTVNDTARWGYHGEQMAHFLAMGGDKIVQAAQSGTFGSALKVHAAVHANGDVAVLMTNTNRNYDANVTLNIAGGNIACVGTRYAYTPINTDQDGTVAGDWIFSNSAGNSVPVLVPKYSTVVVVFPKK